MGALETAMCSMSHCLCVTSLPAISDSHWTTRDNKCLWTGHTFSTVHVLTVFKSYLKVILTSGFIEQATHQIFGTPAGSPRSSLRSSDSRYHSSTQFSSCCTRSSRYSGRCSSSGSPSPRSPPQPVGRAPRRKTPNIHKRRSQDAPSSIHALPWRKTSPGPLAPHARALLLVYPSLYGRAWRLKDTITTQMEVSI